MKLAVKVIPSSSRDAVAGWLDQTLRVKVTAPPEKGQANEAVRSVIAKALGVPKRSVLIVEGRTSARKTLDIMSLSAAEVYKRLSEVNS